MTNLLQSSSQTLVAIRQLPYCTREENESKYESQEYDDETEIGSKTANEIHKAEDAHEKREEACHVFVGEQQSFGAGLELQTISIIKSRVFEISRVICDGSIIKRRQRCSIGKPKRRYYCVRGGAHKIKARLAYRRTQKRRRQTYFQG